MNKTEFLIVLRLELRSLKYFAKAKAVIGFANSLGCILNPLNWYQANAPFISFPKRNSPINDRIEITYKILENLIKKLKGKIWINKKINIRTN